MKKTIGLLVLLSLFCSIGYAEEVIILKKSQVESWKNRLTIVDTLLTNSETELVNLNQKLNEQGILFEDYKTKSTIALNEEKKKTKKLKIENFILKVIIGGFVICGISK